MKPLAAVLVLVIGGACAHSQSPVPAYGEYVSAIPRDCPDADMSVIVVNASRNPLDVYWVVGRRDAAKPGASHRVGRAQTGRSVFRVQENLRNLILSKVEGHWRTVSSVQSGISDQRSITLRCTNGLLP